MRTIASVVTFLMAISSANAAIQVNFSGHFGAAQTLITPNAITPGDSFNGQFIFDVEHPDSVGYRLPPSIPGSILGNSATAYFVELNKNQSTSVSINNAQSLQSSTSLELLITDNSEDFMSGAIYDQNGIQIGEKIASTAGLLPSSVYDVVSIQSTIPSMAILPALLGDAQLPAPSDMTSFRLAALFAADTFNLDGVTPPSQQTMLGLHQPLYWVFGFAQVSNGQFSSGVGLLDQHSVSEVPLPSAIWLFVSVLMGWQLCRRNTAY